MRFIYAENYYIDTSAARREFGIGDDEPLIGTVGNNSGNCKLIVASDVGAVNEQMINDVTGKLILQRNADLIASSVIELLNNSEKAKMMGENGRKLAESKFSIASMIDKTEQLYEKVLTD